MPQNSLHHDFIWKHVREVAGSVQSTTAALYLGEQVFLTIQVHCLWLTVSKKWGHAASLASLVFLSSEIHISRHERSTRLSFHITLSTEINFYFFSNQKHWLLLSLLQLASVQNNILNVNQQQDTYHQTQHTRKCEFFNRLFSESINDQNCEALILAHKQQTLWKKREAFSQVMREARRLFVQDFFLTPSPSLSALQ